MALRFVLLLAMLAIASAVERKLIFSKIAGTIYVQTDDEHYALYGQAKDKDGANMVIAVQGLTHCYQKSNCEVEQNDLDEIREKQLNDYIEVRANWLAEVRGPEASPDSYTWHHDFSDDEKKFSAIRLESDTVVYSSPYFPGDLAKVIVTGNVVIFAHYGGNIALKTRKCLGINEKILLDGIDKINIGEKKRFGFLKSSGDVPLKKHLGSHRLSEPGFELEQEYYKTYTAEENAADDRAIRGSGLRSFQTPWSVVIGV